MLGGNDEVSGQRYLETPTKGDAIDGRDDRLVAYEATGDAAEAHTFVEIRSLLSPGGCHGRRLEVVACRKCPVARPRHDGHPGLIILLEVVEDLAQLNVCIVVERIHHLGSIDRHVGDVSFFLVDHVLITHEVSFLSALGCAIQRSMLCQLATLAPYFPPFPFSFPPPTTRR